jgi:hypothetical protein
VIYRVGRVVYPRWRDEEATDIAMQPVPRLCKCEISLSAHCTVGGGGKPPFLTRKLTSVLLGSLNSSTATYQSDNQRTAKATADLEGTIKLALAFIT